MQQNCIAILFLIFINMPFTCHGQTNNDTQLYIKSITFQGNKITKPFVILREMSIKAGDKIPAAEINKQIEYNKERILNSQLFISAVGNIKSWENDTIAIEYTVKELFYWNAHPFVSLADRNFNVWWNDFDHKLNRINIGADINRKNFRGRGEEIGIEGQAGFNKHIYIYYSNPFIDKTLKNGIKTSIAFNTGKEIQARTDANKQLFFRDEVQNPYKWLRAEFSYLYRPKYASIHELKLSFHHISISDEMWAEQPDFLGGRKRMSIPEIAYRFRYNNTDDRNYPILGWEGETYLDQKGLGLVKGFNQWQFYTHLARYQPLRRNLSAALHFRGRLFGPDKQPYFNYRAMGFKNDYVRGYEYYIVDGSHYALLRTDVRQKIARYDVRQNILPILKHVPVDFYLKTFTDLGYVYSRNFGNSFLNNKLLHGYGLGLDVVFSYYIKVRLEYSFNRLNQNGLFLHLRNE